MPRHTLDDSFECEGIAIHTGEAVRLVVKPAEAGSGLHFARVDLASAPVIAALRDHVANASFATSLALADRPEASVSTVEHLLAALAAAGVDDARIEIDGAEVPVMDGSAAPFADAIARVGLREVEGARRELVVTEPIVVDDGVRRVAVHPADRFCIDVAIDFDHPAIGRQRIVCDDMSPAWFARELAPARTFGFFADVEALRANGLARGASLDNTVVLGDAEVMNEAPLRFADEFVRHKALDLVGDLALLGTPIRARVEAVRAGHALHHLLIEAIVSAPTSWRWREV